MTREQVAILKSDKRRHEALARSLSEPCLKENHEAIAEALAAAIEDWEVSQCKSEIKSVSCRKVSVQIRQKSHSQERKVQRPGR